MPLKHALITLCRDEIAPRFDMTTEAIIVPLTGSEDQSATDRKHLVLAHVSGEELCDVITRAGASVVVCGAIEEDYYHYLRWKRIEVVCDVMGPLEAVLARLNTGALEQGDCLYQPAKEQPRHA